MKKFLVGLALVLIPTLVFAGPEWRSKPVQCGETKDIYRVLIDPHQLVPMFIGVEQVTTSDMEKVVAAIVMYMNIENGEWMLLEQGDYHGEMCIIALGNGLDFDVNTDKIRELLISELKS